MPTARIAPRQTGLSKVIVLVVVLVVLLVSSGTVLALYFAGVFGATTVAAAGDETAQVEAQAAEEEEPLSPPLYVPLDPPLVVNFERNGRMGFLQLTIQAMTRDAEVQEAISRHMPVIRNNLLMLVSSKTYADVATPEGKQLLRQQALDEINKVLDQQRVEGRVEALYFTGFVMQ